MTELRLTVPAADGRVLEVLTDGPEGGLPLVFHNGTPGGLVAYPPLTEQATAQGLRTVMYARPGYGQSTLQPGRRVAGAAADTAAVLDHLGAGPFVTVGWSGGGPHALACAALLPGRCRAVATLAGVAPRDAAGLDWLAGMGEENIEEFGVAEAGQAQLEAMLSQAARTLGAVTADDVVEGMGGLLSAPDKAALRGGFAGYLADSLRAALATGTAGWRDDDLAFVSGWGFTMADLAASGVPVAVWQGGQDLMVPGAHGAWLAGQLPGASSHLLPAEGHLTLAVNCFTEVITELSELAAARSA
jgi:pimeloyl-ACP methyl ester carboxylesterase